MEIQAAAKELAENGFVIMRLICSNAAFSGRSATERPLFLATDSIWGGVFFKDGEWHAVGGKKPGAEIAGGRLSVSPHRRRR